MLKLTDKPATFGILNSRVEKHGDESVPAFDIPLTTLIGKKDVDALLGEGTHDHLFKVEGKSSEPRIPNMTYVLKHKLEGATVTIHVGSKNSGSDMEFEDGKLKGMTLEPINGGETQLSFKLQICPATKYMTRLLHAQQTQVRVTIRDARLALKEDSEQKDLELGGQPEGDKVVPIKGPRGRKPDAPTEDTDPPPLAH